MFARVLVAMDLSPATEALVSALPGLKDFGTREVALVHVTKGVAHPVSRSLRKMKEIRKRLGTLADRLSQEGFEVSVDVRAGSAAAEIDRVVRERSPDIIMMGTRSHSRIREAFVGSVAWEVVRRATRPVLLHRIEAARPDPEAALTSRSSGLPERVLHPTDFSEVAERAVPWLEALARIGVPSFTLLHVLDEDENGGRAEAVEGLEALADRLRQAGAGDVTVEVRRGSPAEEVLRRGGMDPHTMVVMGTQGRGFLPEIVLGSESRPVVRQAAAPVLLVPAPDRVSPAPAPELSPVPPS